MLCLNKIKQRTNFSIFLIKKQGVKTLLFFCDIKKNEIYKTSFDYTNLY